jgi:hypothetical protein
MNAIMAIAPYWVPSLGMWAFDDERHGLEEEPVVSGRSEIITTAVREYLEKGVARCRILFAAGAFAGAQRRLRFHHEKSGGAWYADEEGMRGWLCPARYHYFTAAPETIFVQVQGL